MNYINVPPEVYIRLAAAYANTTNIDEVLHKIGQGHTAPYRELIAFARYIQENGK